MLQQYKENNYNTINNNSSKQGVENLNIKGIDVKPEMETQIIELKRVRDEEVETRQITIKNDEETEEQDKRIGKFT